MIGLTITTSKRFSLFEKTINSFANFCLDKENISHIIHYDDSSSEEERKQMTNIIKNLFPSVKLTSISFSPESFTTKKRHMEIMKQWKTNNETFKFDYVFHLEDDWLFIENFLLLDAVEIMDKNEDIAMVGFSWEKKIFPENFFIPKVIGDFWEWFFSNTFEINEPLFYDEVEMKYLPDNQWVKIINWPYFGFRPAIHDVKKLKTLDNFNDTTDFFELEFATRFSKKYKSFLHSKRVCYHIGNEKSSYTLNNSER